MDDNPVQTLAFSFLLFFFFHNIIFSSAHAWYETILAILVAVFAM